MILKADTDSETSCGLCDGERRVLFVRKLNNPLLPGFYPDPSICRRGEDYYLVTSTFEFFPGVPVFHSRDLVHWHQIGHCLDRPSQLDLTGFGASQGIYAPTIRCHDGLFYMVTTLVGGPFYRGNVNFFVTAEDPAGPWSDPVVIEGAEGIDPTLFFDGGKVYYLGNMRPNPEDRKDKSRHIWLQELDLGTGKLLGERHILRTDGALHHAGTPEGPHLYHIGEYYYLLIAEGGTGHTHAVTVFRSRTLTGPYEGNPRNPLITHRNLSFNSPINSTGHADLIETQNGEWWAVLLGSRPDGGQYRNLGRETFAVPVVWEDGWPVFSPETGHVEFSFPAPDLPECRWPEPPACDAFESPELALCWNFLRTSREPRYSLSARPGFLRLYARPETICEAASPSFLGRRQQHMCFSARTVMEFFPDSPDDRAGMTAFLNERYHLRAELCGGMLTLYRRSGGTDEILARVPCPTQKIWLKIETHFQQYGFFYALQPEEWRELGTADGTILCKETAGGFTGAYLGIYASSGGAVSKGYADFDWFEYRPIPE